MNKYQLFVISLLFIALSTSCNRKKYTEVVEVPLPTYEEKRTMGLPEDVSAEEGAFDLVAVPYAYDALIPSIDVLTMETHFSKHYLGYTNGLNKAIADTDLESSSIEDLLKSLDMNNTELRNNMGGYYNHSLFFETIGPRNNSKPKDSLAAKMNLDFGSFENFKTQFISTANTVIGSGWVWLVVDNSGKLQITTTQNQSNTLQLEKPLVNQSKKLALLLPFNLNKMQNDTVNSITDRLRKDKFLNMTLDFYSGAVMAIDSAKQLGVSVDVSVFDSEETKNNSNIAKLITDNHLENFAAVLGPFYQANVEKAAELLSANQVAVISPLSKEVGKSYPNLFQTITSNSVLRSAIFDFMRSKNGNIIAVVDKKKVSVKKYIQENQKGVRFANLDSTGAINVISLKSLLVKNKINYVVMETANTSMIKATMTALLSVQQWFNVQLVILEPNETLDTDEIEFSDLVKLKLMYPSMTRENTTPQAMLFEKNFKLKNKVTPNAFAIRGFDVTFDALMRLSQTNGLFECANQVTEQVESKFDYFKNETGGFANKGLYILYYDADLIVKEAK